MKNIWASKYATYLSNHNALQHLHIFYKLLWKRSAHPRPYIAGKTKTWKILRQPRATDQRGHKNILCFFKAYCQYYETESSVCTWELVKNTSLFWWDSIPQLLSGAGVLTTWPMSLPGSAGWYESVGWSPIQSKLVNFLKALGYTMSVQCHNICQEGQNPKNKVTSSQHKYTLETTIMGCKLELQNFN